MNDQQALGEKTATNIERVYQSTGAAAAGDRLRQEFTELKDPSAVKAMVDKLTADTATNQILHAISLEAIEPKDNKLLAGDDKGCMVVLGAQDKLKQLAGSSATEGDDAFNKLMAQNVLEQYDDLMGPGTTYDRQLGHDSRLPLGCNPDGVDELDVRRMQGKYEEARLAMAPIPPDVPPAAQPPGDNTQAPGAPGTPPEAPPGAPPEAHAPGDDTQTPGVPVTTPDAPPAASTTKPGEVTPGNQGPELVGAKDPTPGNQGPELVGAKDPAPGNQGPELVGAKDPAPGNQGPELVGSPQDPEAPAKGTIDGGNQEVHVMAGAGYWDVAAVALGYTNGASAKTISDVRAYVNSHTQSRDKTRIFNLMRELQKANHNKVLHPGEEVTVTPQELGLR